MTDLYDKDFVAWSETQAEALRRLADHRPDLAAELDLAHLIEEVEDMAASTAREVRNRTAVLLTHLAKWRWQPGLRTRSWQNTVVEQRGQVEDLLDDNPSLRPRMAVILPKAWRQARRRAGYETGLGQDAFPEQCPFTVEQALDDAFWPE